MAGVHVCKAASRCWVLWGLHSLGTCGGLKSEHTCGERPYAASVTFKQSKEEQSWMLLPPPPHRFLCTLATGMDPALSFSVIPRHGEPQRYVRTYLYVASEAGRRTTSSPCPESNRQCCAQCAAWCIKIHLSQICLCSAASFLSRLNMDIKMSGTRSAALDVPPSRHHIRV